MKFKKIAVILLIIAMTCGMVATLSGCNVKIESDIKVFNVDGELKVGILSDSQLPPEKSDNRKFEENLIKSLQSLKARNVNMILFAGDMGDNASEFMYDTYNNCFQQVFGDNRPIVQHIMGNHDYWGKLGGVGNYRKMFEDKLGQNPWTHYKVNGYHFIGLSPESGNMENAYKKTFKWAKEQLDKAVADDPNKPIFVMTHNSPKDTVYGSDDWGDKNLYKLFKDYPQVVNISGHLHYSLLDERSIYQKDFTAITTQSVSYTEMESGKENGSIPPNAKITPMGYVMDFKTDKIDISRINFQSDMEEKADMRWSLPIPLTKEKFTYTDEQKKQNNTAPSISVDTGSVSHEGQNTFLNFTAGTDNDFVHSYKLVWSDGSDDQFYFSDFYNGISDMKTNVKLQIFNKKPGVYNLKIYAIDSYGLVSENFVQINNVNVLEKTAYQVK